MKILSMLSFVVFLGFLSGCSTIEKTANTQTLNSIRNSPISNSVAVNCETHYEIPSENPVCYKLHEELINAVDKGDLKTMSAAIDKGASVEARLGARVPPLYSAVSFRQKEALIFLLDKGADVNRVLTFGKTPLKAAVYNKDLDIVNILLNRGADVCESSLDQGSALDIAKKTGNQDVTEALINAGADNCNPK